MTMTSHFKNITPEAYAILDELCALNLSNKQINDAFRLIRRMTELGASDKQIWEGVLHISNIGPIGRNQNPRLINATSVSSFANRDFFVERQLLRNPKKVTELITGKARFVFSCVAAFNAQKLAKKIAHLLPKTIVSHTFDVCIQELYNEYAPWMKESCFWETFDQSLQSIATTKLTASTSDAKSSSSQTDRPVYLLQVPTNENEEMNFLSSASIMSQAITFGAEVADIDDCIYLRAHAGDEDMFERWLSLKVAGWKIDKEHFCFKTSEFRPPESEWEYQRCNFLNVDDISYRLNCRLAVGKYERFDVDPGQEIESTNEGCIDRFF